MLRLSPNGIKQVKSGERWERACLEEGCTKSAQGKSDKCITHGGGNICVEERCKKSAQGKSDKCVAHGGGKRCLEVGCDKSAQGKSDRCKTHGGGKRCLEVGCDNGAVGKSERCKTHGGGKICLEVGCDNGAVGKSDTCKKHGGGKRCLEVGCKKSARGGSDKCSIHGGGKRCLEVGCNKSAAGKSDKCSIHGGGKRCLEVECTKSAIGATDKCIAHGGGKRCPNCIDWIDSRSGCSKYDGYCATCFKRVFPDDPRSTVIYEHTKEIAVRNRINEEFEGFIHDRPLYTGNCDCTHRRRVDHRRLINDTILAIETDEFGHRSYTKVHSLSDRYQVSDEEIRYDDLYMIHSGKWIFIRFNPDDNRIHGKVDLDDKLDVLVETVRDQIDRIENGYNTELLEIVKLYC
jgi:hypothetical protein